jgi:flagellar FliL protein
MALEDEHTTVEVTDAQPNEAPKKGGKGLKLALIGAGVVVVGVVLALFVIKPMLAGDGGHEPTAEASKDEHGKSSEGHGGDALTYAIKDIVVNPAGTGGSRFLSVSVDFELGSPKLAAEFESREPLVRDALITILTSKTVSQLTDVKQKEIMRYQIKKRLSALLETEDIKAVYYTDFVLQ